MDPEGPTPSVSNSAMLDGMPDAAIEAFVGLSGPGSHSTAADERVAAARRGARAGRTPAQVRCRWLDGEFLAFGGAIAATPEMAAAGQRDADRVRSLRWRRSGRRGST